MDCALEMVAVMLWGSSAASAGVESTRGDSGEKCEADACGLPARIDAWRPLATPSGAASSPHQRSCFFQFPFRLRRQAMTPQPASKSTQVPGSGLWVTLPLPW